MVSFFLLSLRYINISSLPHIINLLSTAAKDIPHLAWLLFFFFLFPYYRTTWKWPLDGCHKHNLPLKTKEMDSSIHHKSANFSQRMVEQAVASTGNGERQWCPRRLILLIFLRDISEILSSSSTVLLPVCFIIYLHFFFFLPLFSTILQIILDL